MDKKEILFENFEKYQIGTKKLDNWYFEGGEWEIVDDEGQKVLFQKRCGDNMYAIYEKIYGNSILEVDIKMIDHNRWGCGLVQHYQDRWNLYQFEIWSNNNFIRFWQWKNGIYTAIGGQDLTFVPELNKWYHIKIIAENNIFKCSIEPDGTSFLCKNTLYISGKIGLNSSGPIYFKNIRVSQI